MQMTQRFLDLTIPGMPASDISRVVKFFDERSSDVQSCAWIDTDDRVFRAVIDRPEILAVMKRELESTLTIVDDVADLRKPMYLEDFIRSFVPDHFTIVGIADNGAKIGPTGLPEVGGITLVMRVR
jgi:hypothetical protein